MAATHRDLRDLIISGHFREDLFYRLNVIHLVVPPLRERWEDIKPLADAVLARQLPNGNGRVVRSISDEAMAAMRSYHWPGNVRELENVIERLLVGCRHEVAQLEDLPAEMCAPTASARPRTERRRTVADDLFKQLVDGRESFWTAVYPLYMQREITRANVRDLVRKGLEEARGNYKIVVRLFNMEVDDYKKFLNFLRKHDCQVPFKEYR
jgi:DNA-binding NtrC family response regulator